MTLKIACTDLLCLTDILTNHLASSLGIELHTESSSESPQGIRNQMFGITTGFDMLLDHLNSFLQANEGKCIGCFTLTDNWADYSPVLSTVYKLF